ncbi:Sensor protein [Nostocoides japonicum T1-X7]|uniref:histidine kinase n=1 Tax=Nostocoides japonicum T1-X7 TaxID=1194083 RepID=A0A077M5K1_9MICO|nr:ATP-binding protein [Tetrasphaera japonica]CCH79330.1 Sensor protein [Tetrasphaera japonica T1-X7]
MTTGPGPDGRDLLQSLFPGHDDASCLARKVAWSETSVGDPREWPPELTAAIRTVMPSKSPMVLWWGEDLVQIYNDAYRSLLGSKHPQAMGQPAEECWSEIWSDVGPMTAQVLGGGEATYERDLLLLMERHGYVEETYWTFSYSAVRSASGEVLGIFVPSTDVTSDRVVAHRLEAVRELAVLSSADFTSSQALAEGVIAVLSKRRRPLPFAAVYLPDVSGHLARAASYGLAATSDSLPRLVEQGGAHPVARVMTSRSSRLETYAADDLAAEPSPLGPKRPTRAYLLPLGGPDHAPEGVVVLGLNPYRRLGELYKTFLTLVTRQLSALFVEVRTAAEERARTATIAALDEAKTAFFANVSHEFRTPLTIALAAARTLRETTLPDEAAAHVDAIERAARRLNRLVDTLLDFARSESHALVADVHEVDLAELTRDVLGMFRSAVEAAGIALRGDVDETGVVSTDREAWVKVVGNLVSNAYKFTESGSIDVTLRRRGDGVVLTVSDTGRGIAAEEAERVFERFVQVVGRPARGPVGSGIGLALVRDLVRAQGGDVGLESTVGVGTTVTVTLPLAEVAGSDADLSSLDLGESVGGLLHEPALRLATTPSPAATEAEGALLLLVEDNDDLRDYLVRLLSSDGWTVAAFPDVASALRLERVPDLVLCDVMLPGLSGLDLVTMLRAERRWSPVPITLLTARSGAREIAEGLSVGADDYVTKPFDPVELLARLRTQHELARQRRQLVVEAEETASNLEVALASNRMIGMAVGVLMASHRVTSELAFQMLRTRSNDTNRKLREVAEDVVMTGTVEPLPE